MNNEKSQHHIIFAKAEWSATPESRYFRNDAGLIEPMYNDLHRDLHEVCSPVPLLGRLALQRAKSMYSQDSDPLRNVERLIGAFEATTRMKQTGIERELTELASQALESQIYFLKENRRVMTTNVIDLKPSNVVPFKRPSRGRSW